MADQPDKGGVFIDGQAYTIEDLTYKERRTLRKTVGDLLGITAEESRLIELTGLPEEDVMPAFVWTIKRRSNPEYNMDSALELKASDLEAPKDPPKRRASK